MEKGVDIMLVLVISLEFCTSFSSGWLTVLAALKCRMVCLSGTGSSRLSWNTGRYTLRQNCQLVCDLLLDWQPMQLVR